MIMFILIIIALLILWRVITYIDSELGFQFLYSLLMSGGALYIGLLLSANNPQALKPYSDGSFIQLEEDQIWVKVIEQNRVTTQAFALADLEAHESPSDSSAVIKPRHSSDIKQGKKPYALYLPAEDYDTVQQIMD